MKKRADQLALNDRWIRNGLNCRVVSVGYTNLIDQQIVRIAYQDPYTPPDSYKEDIQSADRELEIALDSPNSGDS